MENEIYITRKKQWFEKEPGKDISLDEWTAFVKNDPDMRLDNFTEVKLEDGELFRYDNPGAAIYLQRNCGEMDTHEVVFEYISGNIRVNRLDDCTIEKIRHIAFKLNAHVQAESETTTETEEISLEDSDVPKPAFTFGDLLTPIKKIIHKLEPGTNDSSLNPAPERDNS